VDGEEFLRNYLANEGWLEGKARKRKPKLKVDDDLEDVNLAESFEAAYNFRFSHRR
jgi:hypothetical protein